MRVFIGDQAHTFPARWYWCGPGAKVFPFARGCSPSVWLKNDEVNPYWGEITPYPQDRDAQFIRKLDRGLNAGYPGICYTGQDRWFVDGKLPADVLDGPAPPMMPCCMTPPATAAGGLVLTGAAATRYGPRAGASGGLVLAGAGVPRYGPRVRAAGGLVLTGSARTRGRHQATASGGLVLTGRGDASGRHATTASGGLVLTGQAVPDQFYNVVGRGSLKLQGSATAGVLVPCVHCPRGYTWSVFLFDIIGMTPGTCPECASFNTGWRLVNTGISCNWATVNLVLCHIDTNFVLQINPPDVVLSTQTTSFGGWSAPLAGWDCLSPLTLTGGGSGGFCNGVPTSITIRPETV